VKRTDVNEARWVDLGVDVRRQIHQFTNQTRVDLVFEEEQHGLAL
jgi:hypothetical protein